jgi:hypothetical protein
LEHATANSNDRRQLFGTEYFIRAHLFVVDGPQCIHVGIEFIINRLEHASLEFVTRFELLRAEHFKRVEFNMGR